MATLVAEVLSSQQPGATREEAIMALAAMYSSSYPGRISSQFSLEEMGAKENLDAIASAFAKELSLDSAGRTDCQMLDDSDRAGVTAPLLS